ncbi:MULTISPECIES: hypothetical protein [unclassified Roseofilum]|uniref:hypothetical protein n=1 Tax=unclassified Roseofilum TaxID=2620099 RepID=UPI000E970863|nr:MULTISPECIES: hypothetical protein [unclassified Roseofilum]MBP0010173.1 hypothetical protein [Roseofilum sp. Belize Diploria]MBP0034738.1 hypothetical protein [Roseofilum sp. Belize BBD 4]MBP0037037.1 hypothetical protein [Roseofilum sp. SID1]HBQ99078.1 hypothetical protein [Cyanobacteria bacterium UBA11691]
MTSLAWAVQASSALFQLIQSVALVSSYTASLLMSILDPSDRSKTISNPITSPISSHRGMEQYLKVSSSA